MIKSPTGRIHINQVSLQVAGTSNVNPEEQCDLQTPLPRLAERRRLLIAHDAAHSRVQLHQDALAPLLPSGKLVSPRV